MKILYHIQYPEGFGDDRFIYDGLRRAFEDFGHTVRPLTERDDMETMFREFSPDIFIVALNAVNADIARIAPIMKQARGRGTKVFMRAGRVEPDLFPGRYDAFIALARKDMVADVYHADLLIPKPYFFDLVGRPCEVLPLAGEKRENVPIVPVEKYRCDIMYIGANLPKKRELFRRRLLPLLKRYDVKVFGGDWDMLDRYFLHPLAKIDRILNFGGIFARWRISRQVPVGEESLAYASAKIALNFHEQHKDSPSVFNLNARVFKIPAAGGFEICDFVPEVRDYFSEDEIPMPKTDEEFFKTVDYYLTHEAERKVMQERATARAQKEHTWHNRAQTMLGWYNEAKQP